MTRSRKRNRKRRMPKDDHVRRVETAESVQAKGREGVRPYPGIPELGCGCIPGYFLCADAEALWRQIGMAYQRYRLGEGSWMDCCEVRSRYNEHYLQVRREQPL